MPIHVPGKRNRKNKLAGSAKRSAVAVLSLTAMVDMFTVLVVFLLQNYATTDQILFLPEKVVLPQAKAVKELKPSNVVIISRDGIILNNNKVAEFFDLKEQEDWLLQSLKDKVVALIKDGEKEKKKLGNRIRKAVVKTKDRGKSEPPEIDKFRKMTIQSDKSIDFLTVKKIMYTVTEAGVWEINFAVLERKDEIKNN